MSTRPLFKPNQPIQWILDWDGTMTQKDTLDALVKISAAENAASPITDHWQRVSQAYMDDYAATWKKLVPGGVLPATIREEKLLLSQLKEVEQRSLDRVHSSAIFTGLTPKAIETGASKAIQTGQVQLRNGFSSFYHHICSRDDHSLAILSVNWSRHFIHSCLNASGISLAPHAIVSNELDGISAAEPSSGRIVAASPDNHDHDPILSSSDKLHRFEHMQLVNRPKIYIGDSCTDMECLLAADLGICIRDNPMSTSQITLAQTLQRLGLPCPRLRDWKQDSPHNTAPTNTIVYIQDFTELLQWLENEMVI